MGSTEEEIKVLQAEALAKETDPNFFRQLPAEVPRHRVKLTKPLHFGIHEVTQSEYERVMGVNPSTFADPQSDQFVPPLTQAEATNRKESKERVLRLDTSRHPVEMVSFQDAREFCRKLSGLADEQQARRVYRLPTEAEWENACRAGTTTRWSSGDDEARVLECAWTSQNADWRTHLVGEKKPNAWGLHDMHGSVFEWCLDQYSDSYYAASVAVDPQGPPYLGGPSTRGGACMLGPFFARSAHRGSHGEGRVSYVGFRVLVELQAVP
jgi:formylglycine-generating enzyme required for sulfatase activity